MIVMIRTMAYLMPGTYWKPCQISKMMRHIEKPGLVRTVYSNIFRHTQRYWAIFIHVQAFWGTLRHTEAYSDIEAYWAIFRHSEVSAAIAYITMSYSEPWHIHDLRHFQKLVKRIRWSGIFLEPWHSQNKFAQAFSRIFRDIDAYSATLTGVQLGCRRKAFPALF